MAPFAVGSQDDDARDHTTAEQRIGMATSVVMPLLEFGAIGYVTWVLCYQICFQYLISPSDDRLPVRQSAGIALIVVYAILLLMLLVPWLRLLQVIWTRPDVLQPSISSTTEKKDADPSAIERYDAYVCDYEGAPLFCEKCRIFKPDRTHHCKELGRCVRKMDHYCPWAGGIIAETTHKFFMQFVFYGALYTGYLWLVVAIFLAENVSKVSLPHLLLNYTADMVQDWQPPRDVDWGTRCRSSLLHIHFNHDLHDRLQPRNQLHLGRGDSTRRHLEHCIPHHQDADSASVTASTSLTTDAIHERQQQAIGGRR
jgi:hypothetical protein